MKKPRKTGSNVPAQESLVREDGPGMSLTDTPRSTVIYPHKTVSVPVTAHARLKALHKLFVGMGANEIRNRLGDDAGAAFDRANLGKLTEGNSFWIAVELALEQFGGEK